jgi:hypothetical protein
MVCLVHVLCLQFFSIDLHCFILNNIVMNWNSLGLPLCHNVYSLSVCFFTDLYVLKQYQNTICHSSDGWNSFCIYSLTDWLSIHDNKWGLPWHENNIEGELSLKIYIPTAQIKIPAWNVVAKWFSFVSHSNFIWKQNVCRTNLVIGFISDWVCNSFVIFIRIILYIYFSTCMFILHGMKILINRRTGKFFSALWNFVNFIPGVCEGY